MSFMYDVEDVLRRKEQGLITVETAVESIQKLLCIYDYEKQIQGDTQQKAVKYEV